MCSHNCPKTGLRLSPLSWTRCGPLTRSPWALQKRMRMRLMGRAPLENLRWRGAGVIALLSLSLVRPDGKRVGVSPEIYW